MGFEKIACCYHSLTAYLIQYLLLGASGVGLLFNIIGFIVLKWKYISSFIKFLYILCFFLYFISILSILLLIYYRQKKRINDDKNKLSIKISFANIVISIVGLLLGAIVLVFCSVRYYDHEIDEENGERVITGWTKFFMFLILGLNIRLFLFVFFFWISILIRLMKKTSGAYIETKKDNVVLSNTSTISNGLDTNANKNNNITREVTVAYGARTLNLK